MEKISRRLPAITLRALTVLPGMIVHFDVTREISVRALEKALRSDQKVFLVTQRDPELEEVGRQDVYDQGTIAQVKNLAKLPHGLVRVMAEGECRAFLRELSREENYLTGSVEVCLEEDWNGPEAVAMMRGLKDLLTVYGRETNRLGADILRQLQGLGTLEAVMDQAGALLQVEYTTRQEILEAADKQARFDLLCDILAREIEIARIRGELQKKVKQRVDKNQKDYLLREQLKVIQEELGEDIPQNEAEEYRKKTEDLAAGAQVKARIRREIARFKSLGGNSAEAAVSRNYIETLLAMPWDKQSEDNEDLKHAAQVLDEDHYGLEKVKERVLEFLAVRSLTKKGDSPILCLAGPPGTGKTSIARSIARALDKKYVRISLGGVRDEAEIRGHRRTYIGAMPGRIADALRTAGVSNPLILLDEVDKLGSSANGDPSAALLEVLDAEQNSHFTDHYIDISTDLSQVLFIATANDLNTVPRPLLDRMEVIEVSSYTDNEKFHIAREHLLPKQREHHGLKPEQLSVTDKAVEGIISGYTREAGVRQLERQLGRICRKAARQILEEGRESVRVKAGSLEEYLGRRQYQTLRRGETDETGIVRGLAWTSVGGVTLEVEVSVLPGKGELRLTGQLGDVMKESAATALSYVRSVSGEYGIEDDFFAGRDFHIHIPEGAVPKDGPSAGITIATAILSAVTNRPVRSDTAMTGEITLRGRILAIGGLKEKLLAAKKAGMSQVVVPQSNRPDVEELSGEITDGLHIVYARQMKEVLKAAFAGR